MMRPLLFASALLLATPVAGLAQSCGEAVERAAAEAGIDLSHPAAGEATRPSAPATNESMGVAVMDQLEKPESVVGNDAEGAGAPPGQPADTKAEAEARRLQAEALLLEARTAANDGRDSECRDKLAAVEPLLAEEGEGRPAE